MLIKNMELGWTTVSDIDKARTFFVDKLGLRQTRYNKEFGWIELQAEDEGFKLGLGQKNDHSPYQIGHNVILTFTVENIEAAKKELEEKGVEFVTDIYEIPSHVKMADFVDEDGNAFQLAQTL